MNGNSNLSYLTDEGTVVVRDVKELDRDANSTCVIGDSSKCSDSNENIHENKEIDSNYVKPILWTQIIAAFGCALCHMSVGVIFGFTGVLLPALTNPNSTDIYLTTDKVAIFSSINNLGSVVGALSSGFLMTWIGQRVTLLIALPLGGCSWIMLAYSPTVIWLIVSRFLSGIFSGTYVAACHNYTAEITHTSVRGRLIALSDLMRQVGSLFIVVVGSTNLHWRTVALVCGLITLIPAFGILICMPNSPRWLATVQRKEEARKSLTFFRGATYEVDKELNEIFAQNAADNKGEGMLQRLKILRQPRLLRLFTAICVLMFLSHFTGNVVTMTYSVTIFQLTDTHIDNYLSTIVSVSMRIFGALTYTIIADKFRRKVLLCVPLVVCSVSISSLGVYFYLMLYYDLQSISWLPLASLNVYLFSTAMYYPVFMLLRTELLPTPIRSLATGILITILSVGMFIVIYIFPYMIEYIGPHFTFWFYGLTCLFITALVVVIIPETKNKTLEEIMEITH